MTALAIAVREGSRYVVASGLALIADTAVYLSLIHIAAVHYMLAAPAGYVLGILLIYLMSTRWVFSDRRLTSARSEFVIFALIGIFGLLLNQFVIYICVERFSSSYELAKLASAAVVFGFNFSGRKLILFTRF